MRKQQQEGHSGMYRIKFLSDANADIALISDYIGVELNNPIAADRIVQLIAKNIDYFLIDMPYMFPEATIRKPLKYRYRKMTVKNYLVFYRIDEDEKTVYIHRVIYGKRKLEDILE